MRLRFIVIVSLSLVFTHLSAQKDPNLVLNGGFEDFEVCPTQMSNLNKDVKHWNAPTLGTTDYFNTCSKTKLGIPMNFKGKQETFEGNGYVGLYLLAPKDYREYIQVSLSDTLKRGHRYRLSLSLSLAEKSDGAVMDIGAVFSEKPLSIHTKRHLSQISLSSQTVKTTVIHTFSHSGFYENKKNWMSVALDFVAQGFEKNLVLGNFKNNRATTYLDFKKSPIRTEGYAYYYVDNVVLEYLGPEYLPNQRYVLEHVNFDFDRFELLPKAKQNLKEVYEYLVGHPNLKVDISGHTDDLGSEEYNGLLSKQRANTVVNFLIQLGLDKNRITHEGYGNKKPLDSALTDMARKRNRRVEFVITEFVDE